MVFLKTETFSVESVRRSNVDRPALNLALKSVPNAMLNSMLKSVLNAMLKNNNKTAHFLNRQLVLLDCQLEMTQQNDLIK